MKLCFLLLRAVLPIWVGLSASAESESSFEFSSCKNSSENSSVDLGHLPTESSCQIHSDPLVAKPIRAIKANIDMQARSLFLEKLSKRVRMLAGINIQELEDIKSCLLGPEAKGCTDKNSELKSAIEENWPKMEKGLVYGFSPNWGQIKKHLYDVDSLIPKKINSPFFVGNGLSLDKEGQALYFDDFVSVVNGLAKEACAKRKVPCEDLRSAQYSISKGVEAEVVESLNGEFKSRHRDQFLEAMRKAPIMTFLKSKNPTDQELVLALNEMITNNKKLLEADLDPSMLAGFTPAIEGILRESPEYCDVAKGWIEEVYENDRLKGNLELAAAGTVVTGCIVAGFFSSGIASSLCLAADVGLTSSSLYLRHKDYMMEKTRALGSALDNRMVEDFHRLTSAGQSYSQALALVPLAGLRVGLAIKSGKEGALVAGEAVPKTLNKSASSIGIKGAESPSVKNRGLSAVGERSATVKEGLDRISPSGLDGGLPVKVKPPPDSRVVYLMNPKYLTENIEGNLVKPRVVNYVGKDQHRYQVMSKGDGKLYDSEGVLLSTFDPKRPNKKAIFVITTDGRFLLKVSPEPGKFQHSSLVNGGPVRYAGEMTIKDGVMVRITNRSGHYSPNPDAELLKKYFKEGLGVELKDQQIHLLPRSSGQSSQIHYSEAVVPLPPQSPVYSPKNEAISFLGSSRAASYRGVDPEVFVKAGKLYKANGEILGTQSGELIPFVISDKGRLIVYPKGIPLDADVFHSGYHVRYAGQLKLVEGKVTGVTGRTREFGELPPEEDFLIEYFKQIGIEDIGIKANSKARN